MKADDSRIEMALLADEAQVQRIAATVGIQSGFENGLEAPVSEMIAAIRQKDTAIAADADTIRRLSDQLRSRESEIANLNLQIASMHTRLGTLSDNERELQQKLAVQHDQEATIRSVSGMFTSDEGNVLRDGDNLIIRLYGLTFESGKSDIGPEYYPLLTKVQNVIRKFADCTVAIEGHTDSKGNERINQTLSEGRAKAVAEYLMANMNVDKAISYQGYGDTKPVTTNNTPEGRAKNRRIDVVITPEWASGKK